MRHDDPKNDNRRYFRAGERVFLQNGVWYFAAREGDQGPYPTRERALIEMQRFIKAQTDASLNQFKNGLAEARVARPAEDAPQTPPAAQPAPAGELRLDLEPMVVAPAQNRR